MTLSCILTPAVMYNDNWDELWLVLSAGEQERPSQRGVLRNMKRRVTDRSRMSISLFMVRIFHPIPHVTLVHPEGTSNDSDICDFSKVSDYNGGL